MQIVYVHTLTKQSSYIYVLGWPAFAISLEFLFIQQSDRIAALLGSFVKEISR